MPTPLYITDIIDADIDTTRGGDPSGWDYQFKSVDGGTSFGSIYDTGNSFSDGSAATEPLALRIDLVLENDAAFAIQDFDFITLSFDDRDDLVVWLPAKSDAVDDILYVDSDGNTWYDSALTSPAGGVRTLSDGVSGGDAFGDNEHEFPLSDEVSVDDTISEIIQNLMFELFDSVHVDDGQLITSIQNLVFYLYEQVTVKDDQLSHSIQELTFNLFETVHVSDTPLTSSTSGWGEESRPSGSWSEE